MNREVWGMTVVPSDQYERMRLRAARYELGLRRIEIIVGGSDNPLCEMTMREIALAREEADRVDDPLVGEYGEHILKTETAPDE